MWKIISFSVNIVYLVQSALHSIVIDKKKNSISRMTFKNKKKYFWEIFGISCLNKIYLIL